MKKYYLEDIDVSRLPLFVREQIDKRSQVCGSPYAMIGYHPNHVEPSLNSDTGEYRTFWILMTTDDGSGSFTALKTPWVSPRIDKYLENIRINKDDDF